MDKGALLELMELGMDVADCIVDTSENGVEALQDMLKDDHDIVISTQEADNLIENIHSVVQEELVRWCKDRAQ